MTICVLDYITFFLQIFLFLSKENLSISNQILMLLMIFNHFDVKTFNKFQISGISYYRRQFFLNRYRYRFMKLIFDINLIPNGTIDTCSILHSMKIGGDS